MLVSTYETGGGIMRTVLRTARSLALGSPHATTRVYRLHFGTGLFGVTLRAEVVHQFLG